MKNSIVFLLALCLASVTSEAREVTGRVTSGKKNLSGVIVTDGQNFTKYFSDARKTAQKPASRAEDGQNFTKYFSDERKTAQKPASQVPPRMLIFLDAKEYSLSEKLINLQEYLFYLCSSQRLI